MSDDISAPIKAMGDDWLTIATFIDDRLSQAAATSIDQQNALLQSLTTFFSRKENHKTLAAVAWDLVIPISGLCCEAETSAYAEELFELLVKYGSPREVLLKIVEAADHDTLEDKQDAMDVYMRVQLLLLTAQEQILTTITTKRAISFVLQYMKSILRVVRKAHELYGPCHAYTYELQSFIKRTTSEGALAKLLKQMKQMHDPAAALDKGKSLQRLFLLYALYYTAQSSHSFISQEKLQASRPDRLRSRSGYQKNTCNDPESEAESNMHDAASFADFVLSIVEHEDLWGCGDWAQDSTMTFEDFIADLGAEDDLDLDTCKPSPGGCVLLLAALQRQTSLMPIHHLTSCSSILMHICPEAIISDVLIDSALYLCATLICSATEKDFTEQDPESVLQLIQAISFLSALPISESLRGVANELAIEALSKMSNQFRMDYYVGLMQECPYENLKVATIGMIKDEYLTETPFWTQEVNSVTLMQQIVAQGKQDGDDSVVTMDYRQKYCLQVLALIIFIAQRRQNWSKVLKLFRSWTMDESQELGMSKDDTNPTDDLVSMQLGRALELLNKLEH